MKVSEFKRWLEAQGVDFKNGTNHWKLYYKDHQSVLPRHPAKELDERLRRAIIKQLGM